MRNDKAQVVEISLGFGHLEARISCPADLVPSPGQYLLAGDASAFDPLPVPLFHTESTTGGFITCSPIPRLWTPGTEIVLRGPLGRGFDLPVTARKVALVPFEDSPSRLKGLVTLAMKQGAAVVLVSDSDGDYLPDEVEVQPFSVLEDVLAWADYIAFDVLRERLPELRERLGGKNQVSVKREAQVLIYTPVPCGGIAECGVCAVVTKSGWKLACKDGPVFDLGEF